MDEMSEYFVRKSIKKVQGKPSREEIKKVQIKIQENAAAVPSELGGGRHGYLGLTMSTTEYNNAVSEVFTAHTHPGALPTIPEGATQHQITYAKEEHKKQLKLFKEQRFVERALKSLIINAFEETYLLDLKEDHVGYNNVDIPGFFNHLYRHYGKITDADLLANKEAMNKSWDPDTPIQLVCKQIEDGVKFAKLAGVTTQDKEKVAIGYNLVHKTGEMSAACRDWRKKREDTKSWSTFKTHFTMEYQDYKDENKEVGSSICKAHQVIQDSYNQVLNQVKVEADKDEMTIQELKLNNAELLCQVTKRNEEISEFKGMIKDMQQLVYKLTTLVNSNKGDDQTKKKAHSWYSCCWSHGRTGDSRHTSETCKNPKSNHDKTATVAKRKEGSNHRC